MAWWSTAGLVLALMAGMATWFLDTLGLAAVGGLALLAMVVLWGCSQKCPEMLWVVFAVSFVSVPFQMARLSLGALSVPIPAYFAMLAMGIIGLRSLITREVRFEDHRIMFSLGLVLLGYTLSITAAREPEVSLAFLAKWVFHVLLLVFLMSLRERVWHLRAILALILVTGALSAYGLYLYRTGAVIYLNFYDSTATRTVTGLHLALILPLAVSVAMARRLPVLVRTSVMLAGGLMVTALVFTYSRGPWIGLMAALLVMGLSQGLSRRQLVAFSLVGIGLLYLGYLAPTDVQARFWSIFTLQEDVRNTAVSNALRKQLQMEAFEGIRDHPIRGVGLGNYALRTPKYYLYHSQHVGGNMPHNFYLSIWAEGGLLAFAGFVGMLYFVIQRVLRGLRESTGPIGPDVLRGALGSLTALSTCLFLSDDFNQILVWALLGLAVSGAHAWAVQGSEAVADGEARYSKRPLFAPESPGVKATPAE